MAYFNFTGKLKPIHETEKFKAFESSTFDSGWQRKQFRFNIHTGGNSILLQVQSWLDTKNKVIRTFSNEVDDNGKHRQVEIQWDERFDPKKVSEIVPFRKYTIDLNGKSTFYKALDAKKKIAEKKVTETDLNNWGVENEAGLKSVITGVLKNHFEFISEHDFVDKLMEIVNSEKYQNKKFKVSGMTEIEYSDRNQSYYERLIPRDVYLAEDTARDENSGTVQVLYSADSFVETGNKWVMNCYQKYYDRNLKRNCYAPFKFAYVPQNGDSVGRARNEFLYNMFNKPEGDELYEMGIDFKYLNGTQKEEITENDLSEDQKQMILLGLITMEDIKAGASEGAYGERVKENRFEKFSKKSITGAVESALKVEDLARPKKKEEPKKTYVKAASSASNLSLDDDDDEIDWGDID